MSTSGQPAAGAPHALQDFTTLADHDLLKSYGATRSPDAFAQLVARHRAMVYRSCLRLLGNAHDAEDAAQAVFLILAQRPGLVRRSLAGWLHEAARGIAIDLLRSRASRVRREEEAARMRPSEPTPNEGQLREELDTALAGLPNRLREAVVLRYLEGRSQEEAARVADCPQGTIARRSSEGLNRLRTLLARRGVVVATPAVLIAFLGTEAAVAAPPLAWTAAKLTAAGALAAEGGRAALLAQNMAHALFWAKVKTAVAVVVAVSAVVGATVAVQQARKPLFADHFKATQPGSAWKFVGGTWTQKNGVLSQTSTAVADPRKAVIVDRSYPGDVQIAARVRVDSWVNGDYARAGVGLYTNPADGCGYGLAFHYVDGSRYKVQFLDDSLLWGNAYDFRWDVGTWYWFKLKRQNGILYGKVWRDGASEPSGWPYVQEGWTDRTGGAPSLNGGSSMPGLGAGNATASFADVEVDHP
jgi:RNA polymerase sigma factor (sigma-70 family)